MRTIFKYKLPVAERDVDGEAFMTLNVHRGSSPWHVGIANDEICIWFLVDSSKPIVERVIYVRGTGKPLTGIEGAYIGTVIVPDPTHKPGHDMVWHYFDQQFDFHNPFEVSVTNAVELQEWEEGILNDLDPLIPT